MKTYKDLVTRAQEILTDYLSSNGRAGQEFETINALVSLFDGPEQRAVAAFDQSVETVKQFGGLCLNDYQEQATRTLNSPGAQHSFCPRLLVAPRNDAEREVEQQFHRDVDLIHAIFGMAGEVGEFTDTVKKGMFYGRPLDRENLREEAGDILWYIAGPLCRALHCTLEELARENVAKLAKRYPDKFTEAHAVARLDKVETLPVVKNGPPLAKPEGRVLRTGLSQDEKHAILEKYHGQTVDFSDGFYFDSEDKAWLHVPELWELL